MIGPRPVIAPVQLGCCPESARCLLCNPPPAAPSPAVVRALVHNYRQRRAEPERRPLVVGFYGGPPPSDALLDAVDDHTPVHVRVRPDLLSRAEARRLVDRGVVRIELDALTFDDHALRQVERPHRAGLVREQAQGLRALGVETSVVLTPGLPGTDHAGALRDATEAAALFDLARVQPVLVLDRSGLRAWHTEGRYAPLPLGAAVTVCRDMLEILEAAGCRVIRVGAQPGPDGLGRAVGGPRHSSLRELIEARRALDNIRSLVDGIAPGAHIVVRCAPSDQARTRGPFNQNVRTLRAELAASAVEISPDGRLGRGRWRIEVLEGTSP